LKDPRLRGDDDNAEGLLRRQHPLHHAPCLQNARICIDIDLRAVRRGGIDAALLRRQQADILAERGAGGDRELLVQSGIFEPEVARVMPEIMAGALGFRRAEVPEAKLPALTETSPILVVMY